MNDVKTVVTKGKYAKMKGRAPSAVSNWIAEGKITAAALQGTGNRAQIWVEQADADLAASLDPSQQLTQRVPLNLVAAPPPAAAPAAPATAPRQPAYASERDLDLARRARADADKAEHDAEAARRKLAIDEGKWVEAEEAARVWGRELSKLTSEIETFLFNTLARDLAAEHGLDWKTLAVEVREKFRKFRAETSDQAAARREAIISAAEDQAEKATDAAVDEAELEHAAV